MIFDYDRSTWYGVGEPCSQKIPFELWIYMKAEGTAGDVDAHHVRNECLLSRTIGVVELVTPEVGEPHSERADA